MIDSGSSSIPERSDLLYPGPVYPGGFFVYGGDFVVFLHWVLDLVRLLYSASRHRRREGEKREEKSREAEPRRVSDR